MLPLRPDTTKDLKGFFAGKLPSAQAFNMPNPSRLAQILYADLEAAGIAHVDESGTRFKDFHGLRATMATWLAVCGVHPKVMQDLLRHSDIGLTMNVYTHSLPGQLSEAIAKLPDLSLPEQAQNGAANA